VGKPGAGFCQQQKRCLAHKGALLWGKVCVSGLFGDFMDIFATGSNQFSEISQNCPQKALTKIQFGYAGAQREDEDGKQVE